jgi:hypothetical protein
VCRGSAGACDVAESCDGIDDDCPANGFVAAGTECRASAGVCDPAEACTGVSAACPSDAKSTALCRGSAGICDLPESCDGVGDDCPPNGFVAGGSECRASAGMCDPAEQCTGSTAACPADAKSTAVCRGSADVCDVAESCDGINADCPPNGFVGAGTQCRGSAGVCDVAEVCTGSGAACPTDVFAASTVECRGSAGVCDPAEHCTGGAAVCPPDTKSTALCRGSAGACDVAESCDGVDNDCPPDGFVAVGSECRASAGVCDVAEHCTGSGATCPADAKSTAECRPVAGDCDVAEACDGLGDDCPADTLALPTVVCRPVGGVCDVAESCTGVDVDCPADAKSSAECRPSTGVCDVAESCNGFGNDCPTDVFVGAATVCRAAAGVCDAAESCTGSSGPCPPDAKRTVECRAAAGACDLAEQCDGIHDDCPANAPQPNGTPCNDGNACTQTDACQSFACVGANPVVCTALDQCHEAGTCNPGSGVCSTPVKAEGTPCSDGDVCTGTDACHTGACAGTFIDGCCRNDGECDDRVACTDDHCVERVCLRSPIDERCGPLTDCTAPACEPTMTTDPSGCIVHVAEEERFCSEDDDPCTHDACHDGSCDHEPDGSGDRCQQLQAPFDTTQDLMARAGKLEAMVRTAAAAQCPAVDPARGCHLIAGLAGPGDRLLSLIASADADLHAASLALAGRLGDATMPDTMLDPLVRSKLALGLLDGTPGTLQGFIATLAQARGQKQLANDLARAARADARKLLRGVNKLRNKLRRLSTRRSFFAR